MSILDQLQEVSPVQERNDSIISNVIGSWDNNEPMKALVLSVIKGQESNGLKIGRIGYTAKVGFEAIGCSPYGYSGVLPKGRIDVPIEWLHQDILSLLQVQVSDSGEDLSRVLWHEIKFDYGEVSYSPSLELGINGKNKLFIKIMIMARNSKSRIRWDACWDAFKAHPDYYINVDTDGKVIMPEELGLSYPVVLKETDGLKGYIRYGAMKVSSLGYTYPEGGMVSCNDPKKVLARECRLINHPNAVSVGVKKTFILLDVPESLTDMFVAGNGFMSWDSYGRIGTVRGVNAHGLKAAFAPMLKDWFKGEDVVLLSKGSFKFGLNSIAQILYDLSLSDLLELDENDILDLCMDEISTVKLGDEVVSGFWVEMPIYVTNFYSLYGLRTNKEFKDEDEDELAGSQGGSFYTNTLEEFRLNPDYDMLAVIQDKLDSKELRYAREHVRFKISEFVNAYFTYGKEVGDRFMEKALNLSVKNMRASGKLGLDTICGVSIDVNVYSKEDLRRIAYKVYPNGIYVEPGTLDPEKYSDVETGGRLIDYLLNGDNSDNWSGLLSKDNKIFNVDGNYFFIPGGDVIDEFLFNEEGSDRIFMSAIAQSLGKLFVAIKNPKINWAIKKVNHDLDLQSYLYGEAIDNFPVKGSGSKVVLPGWWLKNNEFTTIDPVYKKYNGESLVCSKMPVLHDTGVDGFKLEAMLPKSIFGYLDKRKRLALKNSVFVDTKTLLDVGNDADGDLYRFFVVRDGLPLRGKEMPKYMSSWCKKYSDGEKELLLEPSTYKKYSGHEVNSAVLEAMENKMYVGKATNALSTFAHLLQVFESRGYFTHEQVRELRGTYSMAIQDYIISGIKKCNTDDNLFKEASLSICLNAYSWNKRFVAREYFKKLFEEYNSGISNLIPLFFKYYNEMSMIEDGVKGLSPLGSRKVFDIISHDYRQVKDEYYVKELDCITQSYRNAVYSSQPYFWMENSKNSGVRNAYKSCFNNLELYKSKYVLWEQDLVQHEDTVIGRLFGMWRELRSNNGE